MINFALEGMMLCGAFAAVLGTWATGSSWIGLLCAMFAGVFVGAVHAGACLKLRANQIVSAIAVNLSGRGLDGIFPEPAFPRLRDFPGVEGLPDLGSILSPACASTDACAASPKGSRSWSRRPLQWGSP